MLQKSYAEGLRALVIYTATWQDKVAIAEAAGDTEAAKTASRVNDLLLPLVKGVGSERAYELLGHESLQTFGGSGFLQDYPLEQYVRDAKIDTLYEGTTAIQSLDLIFRKIVKDQGQALAVVATEMQAFIETEAGNGQLKEERLALGKALGELQAILGIADGLAAAVQGGETRELYKVGLTSRRVLLALGDVVISWLLLRQAEVALKALGTELSPADKSFYEGKVAAARFFTREVLPRIGSDRRIIENTTSTSWTCPRRRSDLCRTLRNDEGRRPAGLCRVQPRAVCCSTSGIEPGSVSDHEPSVRWTASPAVFSPSSRPCLVVRAQQQGHVGHGRVVADHQHRAHVVGDRPEQVDDLGAAAVVQALLVAHLGRRVRPASAWASATATPCQVCRVRAAGEQITRSGPQPLVGQPGAGRVRVRSGRAR